MFFQARYTVVTVGIFAILVFVAAPKAQAGFQWTAPVAGMTTNQPVAAAPVSPVMSEDLPNGMSSIESQGIIPTAPDGPAAAAPIYGNGMTNDPITWNTPHSANRMQVQNQQAMNSQIMSTPRAPQPQSVMPQQQQSTSLYALGTAPTAPIEDGAMPAGYGAYDVTEGFGRDLPLVMAIRQIVPSQYGFIFDDGIDLNSRVSWQGGKPWDVVLQETLTPLNLGASIRGNVVSIIRQNNVSPMKSTSNSLGTLGGPVVMTDTLTQNETMQMKATPVSMIATPDDMMAGGNMATNASAPAASLGSTASWTAPRNSTLRSILEDWSARVGVELYWASEYDYPIQSAVNIEGTFEEAVQTLLKGLSESRPRPMARLHPNLPEGPAVLVIETRQNM